MPLPAPSYVPERRPSLSEYTLVWDGASITFPAASGRGSDRDAFVQDYDQLDELYGKHRGGRGAARIPVRLIPRPDNDYNQLAVSIAAPPRPGASIEDRHLGFVFDSYLAQLGEPTLHDLARFSDDGRDPLRGACRRRRVPFPGPACSAEAARRHPHVLGCARHAAVGQPAFDVPSSPASRSTGWHSHTRSWHTSRPICCRSATSEP